MLLTLPNEIIWYIINMLDICNLYRLMQCSKWIKCMITMFIRANTIIRRRNRKVITYLRIGGRYIRHGRFIQYYNYNAPNGPVLYWTCEYVNGMKHGMLIEAYYSGELKKIEMYKHGILNGVHKQYYRNGKISTLCIYKNGLLDGRRSIYCDNGGIVMEIMYKNGIKHGEYIEYNNHYDISKVGLPVFYYNPKHNYNKCNARMVTERILYRHGECIWIERITYSKDDRLIGK